MIPRPEFYPAEPTPVPGLDLFMTVIKVHDWKRVVDWYVNTLGLLPMFDDPERRFTLLAAGSGRLAVQEDAAAPESAPEAGGARLVFIVPDVEAERARLLERGVEIGPVRENLREGFREVRLHDPAGTPVTLFSWMAHRAASGEDHPPE